MLEMIYCLSLKEFENRRQYMIRQISKIKTIKHRIVDGYYFKNQFVKMKEIK